MDKKEKKRFNIQEVFARKKAVALTYEPERDEAPKVIASGQGYLADRIIETAKGEDIPIHKDSILAETLSNVEVGEYIPQELYKVVAEILIYVDSMDRIKKKVTKRE